MPWRHTWWREPVFFTSPAVISVRMVRDIAGEMDLCAVKFVSLICRDSVRCATLVLESRAGFEVRLILLDPRQNLEDLHRTRYNWQRKPVFCSLQPLEWGTYEHMVDKFASMLQWLNKTCLFSCRVKSSVISRSAPLAPVSRLDGLVLAADHATCLQCSQFRDRVTHLVVGSVKWWRNGPCLIFHALGRASFMCLQTP